MGSGWVTKCQALFEETIMHVNKTTTKTPLALLKGMGVFSLTT
jgi:hypothetical protein